MNQQVVTLAGEWLRERRRALDLTQEALAERAGCSAQTVRKIEAGKQRPSQQLAALLVAQLDVPAQERAALVRHLRSAIAPADPVADPAAAIAAPHPDAAPVSSGRSLPIPLTALIGRAAEVAKLRELLLTFGARLVTLVGPPGVGKTRLALVAAQQLRDEFADGICFVELAPLTDPELVPATIAAALGVARASGSMRTRLGGYLRDKQVLLVLDNFEHLLAAAELVDFLLQEAAGLKLLVTSRTPLHIYGERQFPVPALRVPDPLATMALEEWLQYDAVTLFVARVRDVEPDFLLGAADAVAVAAICARLDGLPLAIELAAARVRVFPPAALLARLGDPLKLLSGGPVNLPARQQTLPDAIAWSYDLLSLEEQQLFRRLSVFQGGATLDAVAAVCKPAAAGDEDLALISALDIVDALISKSLLRQRAGSAPAGQPEPRFWMLETIKDYAGAKLAESGEAAQTRLAHAEFYLKLADVQVWLQPGAAHLAWMARLDDEQDNLRAALGWLLEARSAEQKEGLILAWRTVGELTWYWWERARQAEARGWLTKLLQHEALLAAQPAMPPQTLQRGKAALLLALGVSGPWPTLEARALLEQNLRLYYELGDKQGCALTLYFLADLLISLGDLAAARIRAEEYLAISRELGYTQGIIFALRLLGAVAYAQDAPERGRALIAEALLLIRGLDDWFVRARALLKTAGALAMVRQFAAAEPIWEEYRRLAQEHGHAESVANALYGQGMAAYGQGHFAAALLLYGQGLAKQTVNTLPCGFSVQLAGIEMETALLAQAQGGVERRQPRSVVAPATEAVVAAANRAALLLGAADLLRPDLEALDVAIYDFVAAAARNMLGGPTFEATFAQGRAMSEAQVYAYATTQLGLPSLFDQLELSAEAVLYSGSPPSYLASMM